MTIHAVGDACREEMRWWWGGSVTIHVLGRQIGRPDDERRAGSLSVRGATPWRFGRKNGSATPTARSTRCLRHRVTIADDCIVGLLW